MVDIFGAISDESRRGILELLLQRYVDGSKENEGLNVSELVELTQLSQPTVSKQLKVLRDLGLVTVRSEGQQRFYSIETSPLEAIEDWLIPFLSADFDEEDDDETYEELFGQSDEYDELIPEWPDAVLSAARTAGETVAQLQDQLTRSVDYVNDQLSRVRAYAQSLNKNS